MLVCLWFTRAVAGMRGEEWLHSPWLISTPTVEGPATVTFPGVRAYAGAGSSLLESHLGPSFLGS